MSKKFAVIAASAAVLSLMIAAPAGAEMTTSTNTHASSSIWSAFHLNRSGHITLRGTVTATSSNSVTILSGGKTWIVNLLDRAKVLARHMHRVSVANIKVGDKVMVQGKVDSASSTTVSAKLLQDLSLNEKKVTLHGVISNLSADLRSFTLMLKNGKSVNVKLNSDATVRATSTSTSTLSGLSNGITINVSGLLNGSDNSLAGAKVNLNVNAEKKD